MSESFVLWGFFGYLAMAATCSAIAREKNRSEVGGFFSGLFFGLCAIAYYIAVPVKAPRL